VDANGEIAVDTTITDFSHGLIKYFSTEECAVIAVPVAELTSPANNDTIVYNSTADEFQLQQFPSPTLNAGTAQATTSGTAFDFNSLPAGLRRITIIFDRVSLSGTDNLLVQLGDSGGLETTGYTSLSEYESSIVTSTSGFIIRNAVAGRSFSGHMLLTRVTADTWVQSHAGCDDQTSAHSTIGGGRKGVSAELDRVRITRTGTDTFDLGQVNIIYEL
jgi:hypothetical protein